MIQEDLSRGQRITSYTVDALIDGRWVLAWAGGSAVGHKRIQLVSPAAAGAGRGRGASITQLRLNVTGGVELPANVSLAAFRPCAAGARAGGGGGARPPPQPPHPALKTDERERVEHVAAPPRARAPLPQACATPSTCVVPTFNSLPPRFAPTWEMNWSTVVMPCNAAEAQARAALLGY